MERERTKQIKLGLVGKKLGHSYSPRIHEALFAMCKREGSYMLWEVPEEEILSVPKRMKEEGITGLNVTIPYKEKLIGCLDEVSAEVEEIGALNTLLYEDGKLSGYNTDYAGVLYMFRRAGISLLGKHVTVLGAGGAAKAAIYAFLKAGAASVTVAARDVKKAEEELCGRFPAIHICDLSEGNGIETLEGDILCNTTPVGMFPHAGKSVVGEAVIGKYKVAADMVYNPLETEFLALAKKKGLLLVSGLSMLAGQAVRAQEIWFHEVFPAKAGEEVLQMLKSCMEK